MIMSHEGRREFCNMQCTCAGTKDLRINVSKNKTQKLHDIYIQHYAPSFALAQRQ